MADQLPAEAPKGQALDPVQVPPTPPRYDWLRWAIRITGIVLMFAGTIYLGVTASRVLMDNKPGQRIFLIVGSLIALGLGIMVLRIGLAMLRSINHNTIASFSFLFALIYTFILIQILPSSSLIDDYPFLLCLFVFLYFGLSYWILKRILCRLLLPPESR